VLPQIVHALRAFGAFLGTGQRGQKHGGNDGNDGDDNEQFNKSESRFATGTVCLATDHVLIQK
jgi:hypothetical protein